MHSPIRSAVPVHCASQRLALAPNRQAPTTSWVVDHDEASIPLPAWRSDKNERARQTHPAPRDDPPAARHVATAEDRQIERDCWDRDSVLLARQVVPSTGPSSARSLAGKASLLLS